MFLATYRQFQKGREIDARKADLARLSAALIDADEDILLAHADCCLELEEELCDRHEITHRELVTVSAGAWDQHRAILKTLLASIKEITPNLRTGRAVDRQRAGARILVREFYVLLIRIRAIEENLSSGDERNLVLAAQARNTCSEILRGGRELASLQRNMKRLERNLVDRLKTAAAGDQADV